MHAAYLRIAQNVKFECKHQDRTFFQERTTQRNVIDYTTSGETEKSIIGNEFHTWQQKNFDVLCPMQGEWLEIDSWKEIKSENGINSFYNNSKK